MTDYISGLTIGVKIGNGHFGEVFHGVDPAHGNVAVKVLRREAHHDDARWQLYKGGSLNEAQHLSKATHRNVVQVHHVVEGDGGDSVVICMEYCAGGSLEKKYEAGPMTLRAVKKAATEVLQGLGVLHSRGMLHRDIKPANILLDKNQHIKLTDFGMAKAMSDAPRTSTGQLLGTLKYMAPEQAGHLKLDGKTDLYSLGMVFYELVTGKNLWHQIPNLTIYGHLQTEHSIPPLNFPPDIPEEIQEVIKDLLCFDPAKRLPNAQTLITRLKNFKPILSNSPFGNNARDSDATIVIPRNTLPERLGDDTTEKIPHIPTLPSSTQEPSIQSKDEEKEQVPHDPTPIKKPLEDDPAAKAKDPAKPYYFVDDSQSFNKHLEETKAKQHLFADQFPSPDPHLSQSFFTIKKMLVFTLFIVVGAALYWNQSFFASDQSDTVAIVAQQPGTIETQEEIHQNSVDTQSTDLNEQTNRVIAHPTAEHQDQANSESNISTTDLMERDQPGTDAQHAVDLARQAQATADAQAIERGAQEKAVAEAQVAEPAKQAKTTAK